MKFSDQSLNFAPKKLANKQRFLCKQNKFSKFENNFKIISNFKQQFLNRKRSTFVEAKMSENPPWEDESDSEGDDDWFYSSIKR